MTYKKRNTRRAILGAVPLVILLVAILLLAGGCGKADPTSTPEPTAPPPAAAATPTPTQPPGEEGSEDGSWLRIQEAGKIVVGTSADYPPFEYRNGRFELDGFDIALIKKMAEYLGVQVEFKDLAFDGLLGTLQLELIDVAIGALSVTPERELLFDFTNVYYVGEAAVLAKGDASIAVNAVEDMAGLRVGAQRGSVYESWLRENLVDTELTPPENLFVYASISTPTPGLLEGRVDLLVLDLNPALEAASQGGTKVVGKGINPQRYAIALRHGETALQQELDDALTALQNQGTIALLAQEYLSLAPEDIVPPPTPGPPPPEPETTPPPPTGCVDSMSLVQHLSYDDQGMTAPPPVPAGQPFIKSWRLLNNGTCTWDAAYMLIYVGGNHPAANMGGSFIEIGSQVAPGATYDANVNLVAPQDTGVYQGFWQMRNAQAEFFGERIWIGITVPQPPAPTPAPTQTPSANISFSVDRTEIARGECVTFSWDVQNVKQVYFYEQGGTWENNGVNGQGQRQVCPEKTKEYYLRVVKPDDSVETRTTKIYVTKADSPQVVEFTVQPGPQIQAGTCVDVYWNVQGEVSRVSILRNDTSLWDAAPVQASIQDCPPGIGEMGYTVEVTGPGGTSRSKRTITVVQ